MTLQDIEATLRKEDVRWRDEGEESRYHSNNQDEQGLRGGTVLRGGGAGAIVSVNGGGRLDMNEVKREEEFTQDCDSDDSSIL